MLNFILNKLNAESIRTQRLSMFFFLSPNDAGQDLDGRLIKVELATGTRGSGGNNRKGGGGGGDRYGGRRDRDRGDRNSIRENR